MALVISRVDVDAIPARREGDLSSNGIAMNHRKAVGFLVYRSNTVVVDGTLRYIALVEGSEVLIPRYHSQAGRRRSGEICLDARAGSTACLVVTGTVLVIDSLYYLSNSTCADRTWRHDLHFPCV